MQNWLENDELQQKLFRIKRQLRLQLMCIKYAYYHIKQYFGAQIILRPCKGSNETWKS